MKRSEMIKVIKEYLDICEDGEVSHTTKDKAEYILGCCETWGMLPPTVELKHFPGRTDNGWEPEDGNS